MIIGGWKIGQRKVGKKHQNGNPLVEFNVNYDIHQTTNCSISHFYFSETFRTLTIYVPLKPYIATSLGQYIVLAKDSRSVFVLFIINSTHPLILIFIKFVYLMILILKSLLNFNFDAISDKVQYLYMLLKASTAKIHIYLSKRIYFFIFILCNYFF